MTKGRIKSILNHIKIVENQAEKRKYLTDLKGGAKVLSFINLHAIYLGLKDNSFLKSIEESDIVLRDGIGASILLKIFGRKSGMNMVGTDFIPEILSLFKDLNIVLLGTDEKTVFYATENLRISGCNVIAYKDGFQTTEYYIDFIRVNKADIVILGMGMPKQEIVSIRLKKSVKDDCLIINGGAIIDYLGKKVSRAPKWMRNFRLEWLYRFFLEPKRLFKRYFIEPILILLYLFKERFGI